MHYFEHFSDQLTGVNHFLSITYKQLEGHEYVYLEASRWTKYDTLINPLNENVTLEKTHQIVFRILKNIRIKSKTLQKVFTNMFETEKDRFSFSTSTFKMATRRYTTHA